MGIVSRDRAVVSCFPVISGMIQLVLLWPQGHRMTLGVAALLALRSLVAPPAFTWAGVGARSTQVLCLRICSTAYVEPRGCTSLLGYSLSLLCSALEAAWLLCSSMLGLDTTSSLCAAAHTWLPPTPRSCLPSCIVREKISCFCCSCK